MLYSIADCYSSESGPRFAEYYAAIVGCWMRDVDAEADAMPIITDHLRSGGWRPIRILETKTVDDTTYRSGADGEQFYHQALIDGVVSHAWQLRRVARTSSGTTLELDRARLETAFHEFRRRVTTDGAVIAPFEEARVPPGPDEDVEVPIWMDEADAAAWPASNAIRVGAIELRAMLRALDERGISVGLGLVPRTLVRFHPHAVFAD